MRASRKRLIWAGSVLGVIGVSSLIGFVMFREASGSTSEGGPAQAEAAAMALAVDLGDPRAVDLPTEDVGPTRGWLAGDGTPAVSFVEVTRALWQEGAPACVGTVARLDALGSPDGMRQVVVSAPDPVTAELLTDLHAAVVRVLAACDNGTGSVDARSRGELAWQWALADRRLAQLGSPR